MRKLVKYTSKGRMTARQALWLSVFTTGVVLMISLVPGCLGTIGPFPPSPPITNTAPVADPGPDQTVLVGNQVVLDGSGSFDPDGDPLFYTWTQVDGPPVFLDTPNGPVTTFIADVPGIYEFVLTVDDGLGGVDSSNVFVDAVLFF